MSTMASKITSVSIVTQQIVPTHIKENVKLRVTDLCEGKSPVTGRIPAQKASDAENVSIWWRHREFLNFS